MIAITLALSVAALGCGKRREPAPRPGPSAAASPSAPLPADHALPGELAEGTEAAFGLLLPRRMSVTARFRDAVVARGDLTPEIVTSYVKQRVQAARIETGPARTVFLKATARADPGRVMRIDVVTRSGATELFIRDETVEPPKDGLTPEQRWQKLGLSPDGKPLDPTHLQ